MERHGARLLPTPSAMLFNHVCDHRIGPFRIITQDWNVTDKRTGSRLDDVVGARVETTGTERELG